MATVGTGTSVAAVGAVGSYTLGQLIVQWRSRLNDDRSVSEMENLWTNEEYTTFADYIQKVLLDEIPGIVDDRESVGISVVDLLQGNGLITLSPRILSITSAKLVNETNQLSLVSTAYLDKMYPEWDTVTAATGVPSMLAVQGLGMHQALLYPHLAAASSQLVLAVKRLPILDLNYTAHAGESLEVDAYAHHLFHGIMWQAYMKQDSDAYDSQKSERHRVLWEGVNGQGGAKEQIKRSVLRRRFAVPGYLTITDGVS